MATIPQSRTPQPVQLLNWIFRPLDYMETNQRQLGDMFLARLRVTEWVYVSHPDALKYILTHDAQEFSAPGETNLILKPLLGSNSVIMLSGTRHQERRKLVMPPFHGERLKVYGELIQQIARQVMAELPPGSVFKAREITQKISMRVILQAVFGLHEGDRYERLEALLKARLDMASSPLASTLIFFPVLQRDVGDWSPGHKIQTIAAEIDRLLFEEIRDRRAHPDPSRSDILSLLLMAEDEDGHSLSDQELRDELMTLLVAGHETTATAMAWSLYWVHRQPEIRAQLLEELATSPSDDPIALTKRPYLSAVCNETLRIYPVGMLTFARRVEQSVELMGYPLDPGQVLVGCIYLLHHRPDLYPNPKEFRPERFIERQYSAFEFMPFGAGARRCIGAALAMYEMKIVLGTLLTEFDLALTSDQPVPPQRRGITLGMKGGVEMVLKGNRASKVLATV
ncbi:MAG: cytochrome P450 [Nodosilinea sp.]